MEHKHKHFDGMDAKDLGWSIGKLLVLLSLIYLHLINNIRFLDEEDNIDESVWSAFAFIYVSDGEPTN